MGKKINKSVMVIDNGSYSYIASSLTRWFDTVRYYSPWVCGFPYLGAKVICDGMPGVERIDSIEDFKYSTDIFVICDVYFAPLAAELRRDGYKVFGGGELEYIERDRKLFIDMLSDSGLPVPKGEVIKGLDNLLDYLKDKKDLWIKLSEYRGMAETFHWVSEAYTEHFVNGIKLKYGPYASDPEMEYIVQLPVKSKLEYGIDNRMINGILPEDTFFGFEDKNSFYFIKMDMMKNLPEGLQEVNDKFEKVTKATKYTGFYSNEIRVEDETGTNFFTDITTRAGLPPSASMMHMGDNWGEVIMAAVEGKVVPIKPRFKYCVEILVTSTFKDGWNPISFDEKFKDNIYACYCCMVDGVLWRVPNSQLYSPSDMICIAVGEGDTLEKAIEHGTEVLDSIEAIDMCYKNDLKVRAPEIIENLKKQTGYIF